MTLELRIYFYRTDQQAQGIPKSVQMITAFFLALCCAAFGFWCSSVSNLVLVKPSGIVAHN